MFRRIQQHHGVQLLCATAILLVVIFAEVPGTSKLSNVLQNSGHAPAFGALALLVLSLLPANGRTSLRFLSSAFVVTVGLGVATELVQAVLHRDAELEDVMHDAVGALGALGFYIYYRKRREANIVAARLGLGTGLICVGIALAPLSLCVAAYWHRGNEFPVIAQFKSPLDLYFVAPTDPHATITPNGLYSRLDSGEWPGVEFNEPAPNWSNYRELLIDVSNPGKTALPLAVRVNDRQHNFAYDDRFTRGFTVAPGSRLTVQFSLEDIASAPRGRRMDLSNIATIIIFRSGAVAGQSLLLHRIWLQ